MSAQAETALQNVIKFELMYFVSNEQKLRQRSNAGIMIEKFNG